MRYNPTSGWNSLIANCCLDPSVKSGRELALPSCGLSDRIILADMAGLVLYKFYPLRDGKGFSLPLRSSLTYRFI